MLQHRFERSGREDDVATLAWEMPGELGFLEQQRLVLRVRGLAYLNSAEPLLNDWAAVLRHAYQLWYQDPSATLSRPEVQELLDGSSERTELVSLILLRESWPFGSGHGGPTDEWTRELHSAIRVVRGARDAASILAARAPFEVATAPQLPSVPKDSDGSSSTWSDARRWIASKSFWTQVAASLAAAVIFIFLGFLVSLAIGLIRDGGDGSTATGSIPPPGAVIDASTGSVMRHVVHTTPQFVQVGAGDIFRACDLTREHPCAWKADDATISARPGDVVDFAVRLNNGNDNAIPFARLYVRRYSSVGLLEARVTIEWPGSHQLYKPAPGVEDSAKISLSGGKGFTDLTYIPGSTSLLGSDDRRVIARLPNGIMDTGLKLGEIGAPASCFDCDSKSIRFVHFKARVSSQ